MKKKEDIIIAKLDEILAILKPAPPVEQSGPGSNPDDPPPPPPGGGNEE